MTDTITKTYANLLHSKLPFVMILFMPRVVVVKFFHLFSRI